MLTETLKSLGIDEKQTKVYLACLELGSGTVQEVAEKSGVKRTSIYNFLEEMKQKGLVFEITQKNKTVLTAADPSELVARMRRNYEQAQKILPELLGIFNLPGNKPRVRFYPGIEGIKDAYDDILNTGEDLCGFSDYEKMLAVMDNEYMWNFAKKRTERKMKFFCIAKDGPQGKKVKALDQKQLREIKLVNNVNFETEINIYGNKVAMVSFRQPYTAIIIEDAAIAQTLRSVWRAWWEVLK